MKGSNCEHLTVMHRLKGRSDEQEFPQCSSESITKLVDGSRVRRCNFTFENFDNQTTAWCQSRPHNKSNNTVVSMQSKP